MIQAYATRGYHMYQEPETFIDPGNRFTKTYWKDGQLKISNMEPFSSPFLEWNWKRMFLSLEIVTGRGEMPSKPL